MDIKTERKHKRKHIGSGHFTADRRGCGGCSRIQSVSDPCDPRRSEVNLTERGYALVGLMGVMLFALILTTAAAPAIKYESQREREEEMLWRGHQIQKALMIYFMNSRPNRYPTELSDLVEGVTIGTKRVRLLRPSALCDPMAPCEPGETNWRLVHPGDPLPKELLDALASMQQQQQNGINIPVPPELRKYAQLGAVRLPGQESGEQDGQSDNSPAPATAPGNSFGNSLGNSPGNSLGFDPSGKQPIIGVVSSKSDQMFRSYYGIDSYDRALFFPGVPVVAGGFNRAALIGFGSMGAGNTQLPGASGGNPGAGGGNCQPGEIRVGGQCIRTGVPINPSGQGQPPR
jgi:type II secretory pathway pseudopilin PulG